MYQNKQHKKNTIQKSIEITSRHYKNKLPETVVTKKNKIQRINKLLGSTEVITAIKKEKTKIIETQKRNKYPSSKE